MANICTVQRRALVTVWLLFVWCKCSTYFFISVVTGTLLTLRLILMCVRCCQCRELHCGSITEDMKVVQKNGIGVDCRLDNLALIPVSSQSPILTADETGIYWRAVQRVVVNPVLEVVFCIFDWVSSYLHLGDGFERLGTGNRCRE